jgi:hypothetical protein
MQGAKKAAVLPDPKHMLAECDAAWCARPTRLSGGDDISSLQDSGDCVGLDRSWMRVSAEGDVFDHDRVQASSLELVQR